MDWSRGQQERSWTSKPVASEEIKRTPPPQRGTGCVCDEIRALRERFEKFQGDFEQFRIGFETFKVGMKRFNGED